MNSTRMAPSVRSSRSRANCRQPARSIRRFFAVKPEAPNLSLCLASVLKRFLYIESAASASRGSVTAPDSDPAANSVDVIPNCFVSRSRSRRDTVLSFSLSIPDPPWSNCECENEIIFFIIVTSGEFVQRCRMRCRSKACLPKGGYRFRDKRHASTKSWSNGANQNDRDRLQRRSTPCGRWRNRTAGRALGRRPTIAGHHRAVERRRE